MEAHLRAMITAAFEWARARNLVRVNEVHQEEEAKLILNDSFELVNETGSEINMSGSMEVEDPPPIHVIN